MRGFGILAAAPILVGAIASAQPPAPKLDSGCTTTSGRTECRRTLIVGGPGGMYHYEGGRADSLMMKRMDSIMNKRAVLGLELRATGSKRDTLGVFVENVAPGGPAEKAGIVEGDRIAAINGVDLKVSGADVEDPYTNGLAAHRLSREVEKLTPGARVTLRVYSGGRFHDAEVTAGRMSDLHGAHMKMMGMPGMPGMMHFEGGPGGMMIHPEGMEMMHNEMQLMPGGASGSVTIRNREPGAAMIRTRGQGGEGGPAAGALKIRERTNRIPLMRVRTMMGGRGLIRV
jgi:Trypsin-like serine proteases, typically periplasmic, contain C-terminal PDZ domain